MEDSSSDTQQVEAGLNQAVGNANSEDSSGIGIPSSTSDILFINRDTDSSSSSGIHIVPVLHFDALANAVTSTSASASRRTTTPKSSNKSLLTTLTVGSTTTTVDHTVNDEDMRKKKAKSPASRPASGPPVFGPTNPFSTVRDVCYDILLTFRPIFFIHWITFPAAL